MSVRFISFCDKYVGVFAFIQTFLTALSLIAAIIAIIFAVKAIKESRELATKKELTIRGGIEEKDGQYIYQAVIYNTGYTAINIQTIQLVYDPIRPLALGAVYEFRTEPIICPQQFLQVDIPINLPEGLSSVPGFRIEVIDIESRIFSKEFSWAMG